MTTYILMTSDDIGPYLNRASQVGANTIIDKGDAVKDWNHIKMNLERS